MHRQQSRNRLRKPLLLSAAGLLLTGGLAAGLRTAYADSEVNIARGHTATGSAPCRPEESAGKAVNGSSDGGLADKWCSAARDPFLQVDLGAAVAIDKLIVRHAGAGGEPGAWNTRDFTLAISTDGTTFTDVSTATGNTADVTVHPISPVSARYVRLRVTAPTTAGGGAVRIYELEAYAAGDTPAPPASEPTTSAPTTSAPAACHSDAPATITDYISDHTEKMNRTVCNADVAVYFDDDLTALPAARTAWIAPFATDIWQYMKSAYGNCAADRELPAPIGPGCTQFGAPKPALFFLHEGKHGGGTVNTRFDANSGFRTTVDVGNTGWNESDAVLHDVLVHEACHQVEGASQGTQESPAFPVWGDSKWAEFCVHDFYANTGRDADAARTEQAFLAGRDSLPPGANNTAFFRDWFLPLWHDGGDNAQVMQRFFGLLAQHFPTRQTNDGRNLIYTRRMNTGEFVLFSSAAAGKDLSARAAQAFNSGWSQAEFTQAQRDFPDVTF
ncbi:discoidin domain-containing protein [Mangrovihabitans endophyticus]|uniref:F5/8 type C domain-containing protein n=1 Tax=Mangrovihabitans endophyticus TaxID=1751298 RepID=A0A8J3FPG2_9ACTN|nr:discoidin domain-containing protein [Mangrovihabitans endophyticus]GGL00955.1 hypothetical protein GCM10012284_39410 [Mangrovihabitans endophyticus]